MGNDMRGYIEAEIRERDRKELEVLRARVAELEAENVQLKCELADALAPPTERSTDSVGADCIRCGWPDGPGHPDPSGEPCAGSRIDGTPIDVPRSSDATPRNEGGGLFEHQRSCACGGCNDARHSTCASQDDPFNSAPCANCGALWESHPRTSLHVDRQGYKAPPRTKEARRQGQREGFAIAVGIVGMFEAMRRWRPPMIIERRYWTSELAGQRYYDCACPGCGVQMKLCNAGVDEGTDAEWCGACR